MCTFLKNRQSIVLYLLYVRGPVIFTSTNVFLFLLFIKFKCMHVYKCISGNILASVTPPLIIVCWSVTVLFHIDASLVQFVYKHIYIY